MWSKNCARSAAINVKIENNAPGVGVRDGGTTTIDGKKTRRLIIQAVRQAAGDGELDGVLSGRFEVRPQGRWR